MMVLNEALCDYRCDDVGKGDCLTPQRYLNESKDRASVLLW